MLSVLFPSLGVPSVRLSSQQAPPRGDPSQYQASSPRSRGEGAFLFPAVSASLRERMPGRCNNTNLPFLRVLLSHCSASVQAGVLPGRGFPSPLLLEISPVLLHG